MPKPNRPPGSHSSPRVAICFLSFDRHRLARLTLDRVLRYKPPAWQLRVFQDGARERHSGRLVGDATRIERNLEMFARLGVDVAYQPGINNGTAINIWAAECWAFETVGADFLILIEDDIVISRHFFTTMRALARLASNDPRIGAFSAFGDASIGWLAQWRARHRLQPMHHRWGYGITRDYWLRTRPDYRHYLGLLENFDYRDRPNATIVAWLSGLEHAGATSHITSQDGVRTAIMLKLGCLSVMTTPSYAVNIGKRGMHSFPSFYNENREKIRGRHAFFPLPLRLPTVLSAAAAARLDHENRCLSYW